ncbi:unnamed protein product [Adineta steineri]|uniref:Uncharacterized protein n=2 Tax=Adineta steineri TaxID=433720 RepID=A0A814K105_9BILA|nr:unnamed protein product [Adineta steineri]CAF1142200.1 unnamed protein product [Adineta steineri]CAF3938593.1 unnamed protein product [Adineta steineri]CAF3994189.1 unnamed protein product [Adineta steineri]
MEDVARGEINFFTQTIDGSPAWVDVNAKSAWATSNFAQGPAHVTVHDLRGKETSVNLNIHAMEVHKYDGEINDEFDNNSEKQQIYYNEIISFLKNYLGASRVIIFNHLFRSRGTPRTDEQCDMNHKNPVLYPHVDLDPPGVRWKVNEILGKEEAEKVMQNRFQIINVWRPLGPHVIRNKPLTLCDYSSLDVHNDVHPLEVRGSTNALTSYTVSRNKQDAQRWLYLSDMRSDEMFLIKIFDSNPNVAQFCFHTAFINESFPELKTEQKSIEVRCLVLYDN